ncbi:primase-helicase family protein [Pseudomonas luteola]|uniref:primase-helicase family protein n=1 Tax=Pseudomonas luteola TaxID=47886 RepID=UPI003A8B1622
MSIPLNFLSHAGKIRLVKTFTKDGVQPYPLAKNFNSHTYYLEPSEKGLREALSLMQKHAIDGDCIHRGVLKAPIINESRRNKADPNAPTNILIIDLDDYIPELSFPAQITSAHLAETTKMILATLPEPLNRTACIVNASASTGMKASGAIGLHLFFLLDKPVPGTQMFHWLTDLNFTVPHFESQLKLQRSGMSVKWIVDPVVSRNAQLIYIAPPELQGVADPFASPLDRWALIEGEQWTCDLSDALTTMIPAAVQQKSENMLTTLRRSTGLKKLTPRYRKLDIDGEKVQVLTNPDQLQMTMIRQTDKYVYWNVNGGDSNAYYNPIGNPEVIYNFKGEAPFELKKANEDVYNWYCENFKTQIRDTSDPRPLVFRDHATDQHYAVEYNPRDDRVIRHAKIVRQNIEDWYASYGLPMPDPIPTWDLAFDPQSTVVLDWDNQRMNLFQPTELLKNPTMVLPQYHRKLGEAQDALAELCPSIYRVLWHICGNAVTEFEWFINWLAFLIQTRKKVETAWIFSGCPGTGKGIFFERILRPIIGEQYATKKRLDHLEDQFNAYLQRTLFLVYEEFRLADSKQDGKLLNKLKDEIGSTTTNIRAMRTDTQEVANYTNYIFFSNHQDVIRIEDGDRRFNIAPFQPVPLRAVWPNITQEIDQIDKELGSFVAFLMAYTACERSARTCLANEAKAKMRGAAMGYYERFALAIKTGELDYFLGVFDIDIANDTTKAAQITTAQKYVKHWASEMARGPVRIATSQLLTVFLAMNDAKSMTQTKFTQFLGRHDVEIKRAKVNNSKVACLDVTFFSNLEPEDLAEFSEPQDKPAHANFH